MAKKLINLAKINFAGESGSAPVPPGPGPTADADVVLRDYDGSVVASYTAEDFAALTELPTPPAHEGLTFQGWNWSFADAQAYCAQYGMVDIGATYITSDGKTRINIILTEGRTSPTLGLGINGTVDVDWGDGTAHDTMTGSSLSTLVNQKHIYSQPGDYIITIDVAESEVTFFGDENDTGSFLLWDGSGNALRTYNNAVKSVEIGRGVTSIGSNAFKNCYSLTSVSIPQGVTSIGSNVFRQCFNLTSVTIPQGATSIGSNAFKNCYSLTSVSIPQGVTSIDAKAFNACTSLTSVSIPQSVTTIGSSAFQYCYSLTRICIPQGVTSIGSNAFTGCTSLTSVTIPQGATSIGSNAFNGCTSLTSVSIPQGVTSISNYAFNGCTSLTSVSIPQSVTSIGSNAFNACTSMAIINIFATTPPTIAGDTFTEIPSDCIFYVPDESVAAYKAATYWSSQASKIQPMP